MHKAVSHFKSVINGIESNFYFEASCSTVAAKEALFECLKWIGQIEDAGKKAQEEQQAKVEVPDSEETSMPTQEVV